MPHWADWRCWWKGFCPQSLGPAELPRRCKICQNVYGMYVLANWVWHIRVYISWYIYICIYIYVTCTWVYIDIGMLVWCNIMQCQYCNAMRCSGIYIYICLYLYIYVYEYSSHIYAQKRLERPTSCPRPPCAALGTARLLGHLRSESSSSF